MSQITVYLRFPFNRNGFRDPYNSIWDANKEAALWEVLSRVSNREDINWELLATKLDVSVPFVLQQAALLYEKELHRVRLQMTKVRKGHSQSPGRADNKQDSAYRSKSNSDSNSASNSNTQSRAQSQSQSQSQSRSQTHLHSVSRSASHSAASQPTTSRSSSGGSSQSTHTPGRRLLSQSRFFLTEEDEGPNLGFEPFDRRTNADSANSTDISQGSISKSALAEVMNEMSSSTSRSSNP